MPQDELKICETKTFETVYKQYSKDLRRFIFFKTQDLDKAEDILQETFIKLWDNCGKVKYDSVKSYLYTIATNTFLNMIKHDKVVKKHQDALPRRSTNESPEFIMLENDFMDKLQRTIDSLPEKQKEVFLLNRIENKKYKEIAEQLGVSVKAVEKRMHLALVVMREQIGNV
jgi:RNA polymerase sigma-70 factor (family 1)